MVKPSRSSPRNKAAHLKAFLALAVLFCGFGMISATRVMAKTPLLSTLLQVFYVAKEWTRTTKAMGMKE
jgi:hypothetical protein